MIYVCFVGAVLALFALLVQLRQLHPLVDSSVGFVGAVLALASGKAERR